MCWIKKRVYLYLGGWTVDEHDDWLKDSNQDPDPVKFVTYIAAYVAVMSVLWIFLH